MSIKIIKTVEDLLGAVEISKIEAEKMTKRIEEYKKKASKDIKRRRKKIN